MAILTNVDYFDDLNKLGKLPITVKPQPLLSLEFVLLEGFPSSPFATPIGDVRADADDRRTVAGNLLLRLAGKSSIIGDRPSWIY